MLSNHLQNGMETAKLIWSRLPNSEAEADGGTVDDLSRVKKDYGSSDESLDYEVIENYAYRQEQVQNHSRLFLKFWSFSDLRVEFLVECGFRHVDFIDSRSRSYVSVYWIYYWVYLFDVLHQRENLRKNSLGKINTTNVEKKLVMSRALPQLAFFFLFVHTHFYY